MPRGGERAGAGRKPNAKPGSNVLGFPGVEADAIAAAAAAVASSLLEPPADMLTALKVAEGIALASPSSDAARVAQTLTARAEAWRRYARLAIDQGTLTAPTVPGFRELCEQLVMKEELAGKIARFGIEGKTGRDRLKDYARLAQRVDASLARFKLTAFGKPDDGAGGAAGSAAPMNPWAANR